MTDRITWFDRTGNVLGTFGGRGLQPYLSPDQRKVVVEQFDSRSGVPDLWLFDLHSGGGTRFTFDPAIDTEPVWSPDGSRIVFASNRRRVFDLYQKAADGSGEEELLLTSNESKWPADWSTDGRFIAYDQSTLKTGLDIWILPLSGDRQPVPFLHTPWNECCAAFSPDGRWIAYVSEESGRDEIYVQPFPPTGAKWQMSSGGGTQPKWTRDRREILYLASDGTLMALDIRPGTTFEPGARRALFQMRQSSSSSARYAVTADGQRFLMSAPPIGEPVSRPASLVVNWTAGLKD